MQIAHEFFETSISTFSHYYNPWYPYTIPISGTDGWQFSPDTEETNVLVYFKELCRVFTFDFVGDSEDAFKGYETNTYNLNLTHFSSSVNANKPYSINVDGTTNLTSVYLSPMFATPGNFYGISTDADVQASMPTDANGNQFPTSFESSNSYFVVDELSGTTMQMQSSFQTNFQIFQDLLFMFNQASLYGQFVPNVWTIK